MLRKVDTTFPSAALQNDRSIGLYWQGQNAVPAASYEMHIVRLRPRQCALPDQRIGEAGYQLHQVGLARGVGLLEDVAQVRLHRRVGEAERPRDLRHAAHLDDAEEHAQLARRKLMALG